jgi:hypothetical protein
VSLAQAFTSWCIDQDRNDPWLQMTDVNRIKFRP